MTEGEFNERVDELSSQGKIDKLKGRYVLVVDSKIIKWDNDLENIVQEFQDYSDKCPACVSIQNHGDGDGAKIIKRTFKIADEVINDTTDDDDVLIKPEIKPGAQYTLVVNRKVVKKIDDYDEIKDDFLKSAQWLEEGDSVTLIKSKTQLSSWRKKE